jgi:hypothetical protein
VRLEQHVGLRQAVVERPREAQRVDGRELLARDVGALARPLEECGAMPGEERRGLLNRCRFGVASRAQVNTRTPRSRATRARPRSFTEPFSIWLTVARDNPLSRASEVCVRPMSERRVRMAVLSSRRGDMREV